LRMKRRGRTSQRRYERDYRRTQVESRLDRHVTLPGLLLQAGTHRSMLT
jgi:hypothetical protein